MYLNFDMIASPNYVLGIYDGDGSAFNLSGPAGSAEAEKTFEDYYKSKDIPFIASEFNGRSDYGPFLAKGVPSGGLDTGADGIKTEEQAALFGGEVGKWHDPNYHSAADNVTNLALDAFEITSKAIAHSVAVYGKSWSGFPPRSNATAAAAVAPAGIAARAALAPPIIPGFRGPKSVYNHHPKQVSRRFRPRW